LGAFTDHEKVMELAGQCSVLTCEIEHVNADAMGDAASIVRVEPTTDAIATIQDKYRQKQHFASVGVPLGSFRAVESRADIEAAAAEWGYPLMLKARRLAYDGRGNAAVRSWEEIDAGVDALGGFTPESLFVEQWVPFELEVAVMVVRGRSGEGVSYPCVETIQRDSICDVVIAPARVSDAIREEARHVAEVAVKSLTGAGVFGVELFVTGSTVLLNEVAPRPHNSGHYTIEACECDQFENHLRAILGLPLGSTSMRVGGAVMVNVLGTGSAPEDTALTWAPAARAMAVPGACVHWYGKYGVRKGRKVGHITVTGNTLHQALDRAEVILGRTLGSSAAATSVPPLAESDSDFLAIKPAAATVPPLVGIIMGSDSDLPTMKPAAATVPPLVGIIMGSDSDLPTMKPAAATVPPLVGIIMGSDSDLPTMKPAASTLRDFGVPFEVTIVSAHRTPDRLVEYARGARGRGIRVIIAAAGGAAHLPGMVAAMTPLPVVGVPVPLKHLDGVDSLHSIVQMPKGVPVATVAIGNSVNGALTAVRILGAADPTLLDRMEAYQREMESQVLAKAARLEEVGWEAYP
jgi:phosphoribosylaminoimidazole carboxylase